jgi:hypothetical protein
MEQRELNSPSSVTTQVVIAKKYSLTANAAANAGLAGSRTLDSRLLIGNTSLIWDRQVANTTTALSFQDYHAHRQHTTLDPHEDLSAWRRVSGQRAYLPIGSRY